MINKKLLIFCLYNIIIVSVTIKCCEEKKSKDNFSESKKNHPHEHNLIKIPPRFKTVNLQKKLKIRHIKLSNIDTTEKCKKFKNIEKETVIVLCDFCSSKQLGTLWVARYQAIEHRKEQHLICECGKPHETSYAASHCEDCH